MEDADIRIAHVFANEDGEGSDAIVALAGDEKEFGVEGEPVYGHMFEQILRDWSAEEFESTLRVRKLETAKDEDLEQMESAGGDDAVPRRRFFESCTGGETRSDDDVGSGLIEDGHELIELVYRYGKIGIDEQYRIVFGSEDSGFDGSAFALVLLEPDVGEWDVRPVFLESIDDIRRLVGTAVGHDNNLVTVKPFEQVLVYGEYIGNDHLSLLVAGDDNGDFRIDHNDIDSDGRYSKALSV